jgi:hypothetical protein
MVGADATVRGNQPALRPPVPRPAIRFVGIRHLEESFVPRGAFGFPRVTDLFPPQHEPASFSLHGDDLALVLRLKV